VPAPGDPQSLNRYAYTLNNPVRYTDPSGHCIPGWNCPGDNSGDSGRGGGRGWKGAYSPTFVNPGQFGFIPGYNVDRLPYYFYQHPTQFSFTASVEFDTEYVRLAAEGICIAIGQGCIPDIPNKMEHYPVLFDISNNPENPSEKRWIRSIVVDGETIVLFDAYWSVVEIGGQSVVSERFVFSPVRDTLLKDTTVYLEPRVGDANLSPGHKDPLTWQAVALGAHGKSSTIPHVNNVAALSITFQTKQVSPNRIQTIGTFYLGTRRLGRVLLDGICQNCQ